MKKSTNKLNKRIIGLNLVIYMLLVYFVFHALSGERGVFAYLKLSTELEEKQHLLAELRNQRTVLEKKIHLLNQDNLKLDMLDELARKNLGLAAKEEIVVMIKTNEQNGL